MFSDVTLSINLYRNITFRYTRSVHKTQLLSLVVSVRVRVPSLVIIKIFLNDNLMDIPIYHRSIRLISHYVKFDVLCVFSC